MRRSRLEIINEMLLEIQKKGGKIKQTHLMYKANLSYKLLIAYLSELISKGLIKEIIEGNNKFLVLTDRGREFILTFKKMINFKETFGI